MMQDLNEFESLHSEEENRPSTTKQPLKNLDFAVKRVVNVAIPFHIQTLQQQCEKIEELQTCREWKLLQCEQISASNTVKLLKSDIRELEYLNDQVRPEDVELFQKKIQIPTKEVVEALASFVTAHSNITQPFPKFENEYSARSKKEFPTLVCNLDKDAEPCTVFENESVANISKSDDIVAEPYKAYKRWFKLKNDLVELNEIIKKFASLVFSQKESVDRIEDNILQTHANVQEGTKQLRKALILQTAALPVAGAVAGGLLLGPIGALVGLKLFGSLACAASGSLLGYKAGSKYKSNRQASCDIEMKALTYATKTRSVSSPDLPISDDTVSNDLCDTVESKNK